MAELMPICLYSELPAGMLVGVPAEGGTMDKSVETQAVPESLEGGLLGPLPVVMKYLRKLLHRRWAR